MFHKAFELPYVVSATLENDVEIREYLPQIWAASLAARESGSFRTLAAYVFGDNDRQERIGMTAPVINAEDRIAFIMPGRYNLENLPRPLSERIKIESVGARRLAAIMFSGFADPNEKERNLALLQNTLERHGIRIQGGALLMRYDPPWTPPFLRRNEIALLISEERTIEKSKVIRRCLL